MIDFDKPAEPSYQMKRLRDMLDLESIPWHDNSDPLICRTQSDEMRAVKTIDEKGREKVVERRLFSVVGGKYTYGGSEGLLEAWMPWMVDPQGHYTAEDVMEMVRRAIAWDGDFTTGDKSL